MTARIGARWVALAILASAARAEPPRPQALAAAAAVGALGRSNSTEALASNLRGFLVRSLPDPLFEDVRHWGRQEKGPRGKLRNDGRWWKVRATAVSPADTLKLDLRDLQRPAPGQTVLTAHLALDVRVVLDRQTWALGLRLYSGSTRARLRVKLTVRCEVTTRVQANGTLFPEAVFRLRVLESDIRYDNLVVEHTAGVGGDAAKLLGEMMLDAAHRFRPSLERDLLAKANAAILKAGDTKEVRVSLMGMFDGKQRAAPAPPSPKK